MNATLLNYNFIFSKKKKKKKKKKEEESLALKFDLIEFIIMTILRGGNLCSRVGFVSCKLTSIRLYRSTPT